MEQRIVSFDIKEQLMVMLQNVNDMNKKRTRLEAASSLLVTDMIQVCWITNSIVSFQSGSALYWRAKLTGA